MPGSVAGLALADGLEEEDGGGDGGIQRIEPAQHGDADVSVGGASPLLCQAGGFGADHDGRPVRHVAVIIPHAVLQLGRQDADAERLEPGDG